MNVIQEYSELYAGDYLTADCCGGRAGARSHSITQHALMELLYSPYMRGFFLRDVHSTIYASIWQDFKDRISELAETRPDLAELIDYSDNKNGENYATNKANGNSITTKGFKVSSGTQTASLKSLAAATHLYIEEADEVQKVEYLKLKLSLRKKGANIKIIRAFNPPHRSHWIWDDYELEKVTTAEIREAILRTSNLREATIDGLLARNDKTYFRAKPKGERHICIFTTHYNNYENLNPDVFPVYDEILIDDIHYYIVTILGFIANEDADTVYHEYDPVKNHTERTVSSSGVLHVGMDFNVGNMSAVIHEVVRDEAYAVAELTKVLDTQKMCELISEQFPNNRITVYPDASGRNKSTSSKKSDHDIIRGFGFQLISDPQNPAVRDRVNVMNSQFRKGKYFVNRFTCPEYSEALEKQKYKNGEPDKSKGYDHLPDAGGYFIHKQFGRSRAVKFKMSF